MKSLPGFLRDRRGMAIEMALVAMFVVSAFITLIFLLANFSVKTVDLRCDDMLARADVDAILDEYISGNGVVETEHIPSGYSVICTNVDIGETSNKSLRVFSNGKVVLSAEAVYDVAVPSFGLVSYRYRADETEKMFETYASAYKSGVRAFINAVESGIYPGYTASVAQDEGSSTITLTVSEAGEGGATVLIADFTVTDGIINVMNYQ